MWCRPLRHTVVTSARAMGMFTCVGIMHHAPTLPYHDTSVCACARVNPSIPYGYVRV